MVECGFIWPLIDPILQSEKVLRSLYVARTKDVYKYVLDLHYILCLCINLLSLLKIFSRIAITLVAPSLD